MKKIIFGSLLLLLSACDGQLDIIPKGKTTLDNVADLELLLNQEYALQTPAADDLGLVCNESLGGMMVSLSEMLSVNNTLNYAYLAYDEKVDRVTLAKNDTRYENAYRYINYMNIIIEKIGKASGDESRKPALIAEARILRAYFHWLLVNIYAAQYDEATATEQGGIAYVDNSDVAEQKTKLTLEDTYLHILDDCSDEVIAQLPVRDGDDVFRADQAFGNAVRAKVLMQMKRYGDALPYALEALRLNGKIEDRSAIKEASAWELKSSVANNYVYMRGTSRAAPFMETLSLETGAMFEEGDYVINYTTNWNESFGEMFIGLPGCKLFFGMTTSINEYGINSDRMYYTAAECCIRTGEIRKGLELVDRVRAYRVENYQSFAELYDQNSLTEKEAMALMQKAKWIECISTYENFFDCKRWNTEEHYRRTITRNLGEYGSYSLSPDSPLWIFPFPANATRYNSSLTQNY